jgi:hypothetical protein
MDGDGNNKNQDEVNKQGARSASIPRPLLEDPSRFSSDSRCQ